MVRVAVLVAVTLTVPIVLFPVSTLSPEEWVRGSDSLWIWVSGCLGVCRGGSQPIIISSQNFGAT